MESRFWLRLVDRNKKQELEILERDLTHLKNVKRPFPRIHYNEAVEILKKNNAIPTTIVSFTNPL